MSPHCRCQKLNGLSCVHGYRSVRRVPSNLVVRNKKTVTLTQNRSTASVTIRIVVSEEMRSEAA